MRVIGVTGGTGAGKTSLLEYLKTKGAALLDCDKIYYEMLAEDADLRVHLKDCFGEVFLPDGSLDRKKLGKIVYEDAEKMRLLNMIVYYFMGLEIRKRLQKLRDDGAALVAIDAVNLIESGLGELCDTTVGIIAPEEDRLARIMARDGIDREYALSRIRAQKDDDYYRRHCRIILENTGKEEELPALAEKTLADIL